MNYKFLVGDLVNIVNPSLDFPWYTSVREFLGLRNWDYGKRVPEDSSLEYVITSRDVCKYSGQNIYAIINPKTNEEYLMDEEGLNYRKPRLRCSTFPLNQDAQNNMSKLQEKFNKDIEAINKMSDTRKIKAVTVIKDFPNNMWRIDWKYSNNQSEFAELLKVASLSWFEEYFEIEYELEPILKLLKRLDGSLISEPEEGTPCCKITGVKNYYKYYDIYLDDFREESDCLDLKMGMIFLEEDEQLAEKKASMLSKQLEIQYEIDRLNAEDPVNSKTWFLEYNHVFEEVVRKTFSFIPVVILKNYMTDGVYKKIIEKYSQDELMQYLGIII